MIRLIISAAKFYALPAKSDELCIIWVCGVGRWVLVLKILVQIFTIVRPVDLGCLSVVPSQRVPAVSDDVLVFDDKILLSCGTNCWHCGLEILQSLFLLYIGTNNSHSTTACQHSSNYLESSESLV